VTTTSFPRLSLAALALAAGTGIAQADIQADAQRVLQHRLAMPVPVTVFEKWQADQWTFSAMSCWAVTPNRSREVESALNKLPIYGAGSHSAAKDDAKTCSTLAENGPKAVCFDLFAREAPFALPWAGMPTNYLYLATAALPKAGTMFVVGGYCQLVANKPETKQFFAGKGKLVWLAQPQVTSLNTASGARTLRLGTVAFEVQGMPGTAWPVTILVP